MSAPAWTAGPLESRADLSVGHGWHVGPAGNGQAFTALYCTEADAQLYAAAPDMADALVELSAATLGLDGLTGSGDAITRADMDLWVRVEAAQRAARLALSKARGEAQ